MLELNLLKIIIKLFFYVFLGSLFVYLIQGLFAFMENDLSYLNESATSSEHKITFLIFFIKIISKTVFFIGGFYLIKILNFNDLKEVFSDKKIKLFKKSGKLIIFSSIIGAVAILIKVFNSSFASLKSNNDFMYSLYFSAIVGLFLLIFSLILQKAKELKQENDLTI